MLDELELKKKTNNKNTCGTWKENISFQPLQTHWGNWQGPSLLGALGGTETPSKICRKKNNTATTDEMQEDFAFPS